jgi:hypothetical protein
LVAGSSVGSSVGIGVGEFVGFLAQDVEKLEEEFGYQIENKTNLTTTLSGDGKMYGLTYSKFIPSLVKAIQELSAEVEELKSKMHDKCEE